MEHVIATKAVRLELDANLTSISNAELRRVEKALSAAMEFVRSTRESQLDHQRYRHKPRKARHS